MTETGTVEALLDAAEAAFAEHGVDNVSLRSIMRAAGANTASVHYHYGSRDELARAVLNRVLAPVQARRLELLDELVPSTTGQRPPTTEQLVRALVQPDFEAMVAASNRNPAGARLIGTIYARPSAFVKSLVEESFAPVAIRFQPHLQAAVQHVSPPELAWRVRWVVFGVLGALLSDADVTITDRNMETELARVIAVLVGALSAPSTT